MTSELATTRFPPLPEVPIGLPAPRAGAERPIYTRRLMTSPDPTHLEVLTTADNATAALGQTVLDGALSPVELDDRFERWDDGPDQRPPFVAAVAHRSGTPVAYLGGAVDGGRLALDGLVDRSVEVEGPDAAAGLLAELFAAIDDHLDRAGAEPRPAIELWGRPARPWHEQVAARRGLVAARTLHQMRCRLPVTAEPVPTRGFVEADLDALVSVNNRAFAAHPDQGGQTPDSIRATMAQPWFDPDGLRVFEQDGRMAGFCWTKVHPSPPAPVELGEIFVIGVDPDFHGRGFGVPMTAAGLVWLADRGIETGMLYVEGDNVPAIRTYERLTFSIVRTDRSWVEP